MCEHGDETILYVPTPAHLSHTGELRWDNKGVDTCIAPIVQALNDAGVLTANSCCGHGKMDGSIILHDGRELIIKPAKVESKPKMNQQEKLKVTAEIFGQVIPLVYAQAHTFRFELSQLTYQIACHPTSLDPYALFTWSSPSGTEYQWVYIYGSDRITVSVMNKRRGPYYVQEDVTAKDIAAGLILMMQGGNAQSVLDIIRQSVLSRMEDPDEHE